MLNFIHTCCYCAVTVSGVIQICLSVSYRETYLNNTTHCYSTIQTRGDNITQSSAPEDGHMVARNMWSNL